MNTIKNKKVALVLSGGGARGMAHIGVIEELERHGFEITSVAGTSIGSVIGAIYISGKLEQFKKWVAKRGKLDIIKLMDFAITKNGFIKGEKVFKALQKYIDDVRIEDLPIPYTTVAVDIVNHKEIVFDSGNLIEAIRASIAIPTVLRPYVKDGLELVDGGVLNPLPLNLVHRSENSQLVAVDLNADITYEAPGKFKNMNNQAKTYDKALEFVNEKWSSFFKNGKNKRTGFFDLVTHSIYAMQIKMTQISIEKYKPDLLIEISKNSCDMFEFHRAEELIQYGKDQFNRVFDGGK